MRKFNPWAFGILFLGFFAYFAWNGFTLPTVFFGKTLTKNAVIYDAQMHTVSFGKQVNWTQTVRYFYQVENEWYDGSYTLKGAQSRQRVGNLISLEISKSRPQKHRIRAFYKSGWHYGNMEKQFETRQISGYKKFHFTNQVFSLIDFSAKKDSISKYYGVLQVKNDSVKELVPIIHYYKSKTYLEYQLIDKALKNKFHQKYQLMKQNKDRRSIQLKPMQETFYKS
ncbi:hypothetical protein [Marinifilum caeruleilacunae]|uniref:DUF3108 domain-containing protein n=1 Tax=Marinifilum caeruleilacunae TaxID=2499076 RepID=A0ABX1WZW9_9BACT|nr:hypothetical protein [Marinifilum caeruleilacunae]NOU61414.1 hypothetical protein [Marinifilum caeruleilacunae]